MSDAGGWVVRACTADDVGTVLALARADEERVTRRSSQLVEGDLRDWWQSVDLPADSWLLSSPRSGAAVAAGWLDPQGTSLGISYPIAADPAGLAPVVELAERRAEELGLERL